MITREFLKGDARSIANYSDCEKYRYDLTRVWDKSGKRVMFLMLNPSTATEVQNDPTVERCERRARTLGYGGFRVCNIFAFRATDPKVMRAEADPVGPLNDEIMRAGIEWSDDLVAAWGANGEHMDRGAQVEALLRGLDVSPKHLGLTKAGHPKHPLYIGYRVQPEIWW